jgi:hypothetical protein
MYAWQGSSRDVERRRGPTEQDGRAGSHDLRHRDAGEHVDAVEDQRAHEGHRGDQAHQRDGHDLDRNARLDAIEQVLARIFSVTEVSSRGDREDRHRLGAQLRAIRPKQLHHLRHAGNTVLAERPRHDGLLRRRQAHVEPPGVRDLRLDVIVGRERRGEVGDVLEPVTQPRVLDEVAGVREPSLVRAVVENLQAARGGHEVHVVAAELGVGLAVAIVERDGLRGALDRLVDLVR